MENLLFDKTYGCLAGGAVGDAMGGPVEAWHYEAIRKKYAKIEGLIPDLGVHQLRTGKGPYTFTDDTHLSHLLCKAIIEKRGRVTAYDLAKCWLENMDLFVMAWDSSYIYAKLCYGIPAREAGLGNFQTVAGTLGCAPIGILNACDPRGAALDAYEIASLNVCSYSQEAPMSIAAAIAEAFKPLSTVESIIEASTRYCGPVMEQRIRRALEVAKKYDDVFEAIPEFYEKLLVPDGIDQMGLHRIKFGQSPLSEEAYSTSASALEMIPVALAFFCIARGDPLQAMTGATNFGRDCDGTAGLAGAIAGAWKGIGAFDLEIVKKVNEANSVDLGELARQMQIPILNTMREKQESVELLNKLVQ